MFIEIDFDLESQVRSFCARDSSPDFPKEVTKKKGDFAMKKSELIAKLAEAASITKKEAEAVYGALVKTAGEQVKAVGTFKLPDLGTLKVGERKARKGVNPQTKQPIDIPASKTVTFKASKALKDAVK